MWTPPQASWPPRWITLPPPGYQTRGQLICDFIEGFCRITKESVGGEAGELLRLRTWQRNLIYALFTEKPTGRLLYRHGLIGVARKNTKSTIGASLALAGLVLGKPGSEVYSCAGDKDQAKIVFSTAKAMIEVDEELKALCRVYKDVIEVESSGSIYRALSSEAYTKEGLNPNLVIFDEVHVQPNDDLWNVMELASGARPEPLMLGITTAGVRTDRLGNDSLCYRMYKHGIEVALGNIDDPTFFFAWWEPKDGAFADHRDPKVWAEANPGIGDLVTIEDFYSTLPRVPESEFRTKRTNVFVSSSEAWLPFGAWKACEVDVPEIEEGATVVLGFDGSYNNDSTVIVAATKAEKPYVQTVRVWEKPSEEHTDWVVPVDEVENAIRAACKRWRVIEIVCDPARWAKSLQTLAKEGYPVVEFPQSPERMIPATQRFYEAVMNRHLRHGNDSVLARHIDNAVLKITERGSRIVKQTRGAMAKIDAAVAAVMAHDRAASPMSPFAGWLSFAHGEVMRQEAKLGENLREQVRPQEAKSEAAQAPTSPRDILLGRGAPMPKPRNLCQHRWHPLDHTCVFCGAKKEIV